MKNRTLFTGTGVLALSVLTRAAGCDGPREPSAPDAGDLLGPFLAMSQGANPRVELTADDGDRTRPGSARSPPANGR